jgi:folate-dependent phosphoribosylglycinamide formyltransferase PurN
MHFLRRVRFGLSYENDKEKIMNIAVFASGRGTNFSAIAKAIKQGKLNKASLALLVCDNPDAGVIKKARRSGVKIALVKRGFYW